MTLRGATVAMCVALFCAACGDDPKPSVDPVYEALIVPCFKDAQYGGRVHNWDGWKINDDVFEMSYLPTSRHTRTGERNLRCAMDGLGISKVIQDQVFSTRDGFELDYAYSVKWSSAEREADNSLIIGGTRVTVQVTRLFTNP